MIILSDTVASILFGFFFLLPNLEKKKKKKENKNIAVSNTTWFVFEIMKYFQNMKRKKIKSELSQVKAV